MIYHALKFTSRVAHMACTAILSGLAVINFFFGKILYHSVLGTESERTLKMLAGVCGSVVIFSGLANIHLIKGRKSVWDYKSWYILLILKFALALILTPLFVSSLSFVGKAICAISF
jgi:hypothetical protein